MKAIITIGLPGSGKSYWARQEAANNPDIAHIERDMIRQDVYPNWPDYRPTKAREEEVTVRWRNQIMGAHMMGDDIIIADTNLNKKTLADTQSLLSGLGYEIELKYFTDVPFKTIQKRNRMREAYVPDHILENMVRNNLELFPWAHEEFSIPVNGTFTPNIDKEPCIIVDVDGTIADASKNKRSMFDMTRVDEDAPIDIVIDAVLALAKRRNAEIIIVSARSGSAIGRKLTEEWLEDYIPDYCELIMREEFDNRKDNIVKEELFWKYIANRYNPIAVFDDRMQVVKLWANLGLHVFQCYQPGKPNNDF